MKKYVIFAVVSAFILSSCGKSDTDFDIDDEFRQIEQIPGDNTDTVGIHKFLGDKYFMIKAREQRLLYYVKEKGLYSFQAIALPESDNSSKDIYPQEIQDVMFDCSNKNYFLGFPTSVVIDGKPFIVAERRESEVLANEYSDGVFLNVDQNSKWNFTEFFKYAPFGNSFMETRPMIGRTDDGKLVVKANIGVLLSSDNGKNWTHIPKAFDALNPKDYTVLSANMAYHHKFGAIFFGTGHRKMKNDIVESALFKIDTETGEASEILRDWIPAIKRGEVETEIAEPGIPVFHVIDASKDPDLAAYDGYIIAFSVFKEKIYQYVYAYKPGDTWDDVTFTVTQTTITGSLSRHAPPGLIYNPVSKRFELIQSIPYELSLHSISVSDLMNNSMNEYGRSQWKKEVSLLQREIGVRGQGMYPVSSLVDKQKGVQRVFISMGDEYPGRCGIFELIRTLNTSELADYTNKKRNFIINQPW